MCERYKFIKQVLQAAMGSSSSVEKADSISHAEDESRDIGLINLRIEHLGFGSVTIILAIAIIFLYRKLRKARKELEAARGGASATYKKADSNKKGGSQVVLRIEHEPDKAPTSPSQRRNENIVCG